MPVQLDQHFWAARLHAVGVSPRPLRYQHRSTERLSHAITTAVHDPALRSRARHAAALLAMEDGDGTQRVLDAVERLG